MRQITRRMAVLAALAGATSGCAALMPYIVAAGQVAQWVAAVIDQVERVSDTYFEHTPDQDLELLVNEAIAGVRAALAALDAATLAARASHDGNVEAAKRHLLEAYRELYRLLETVGLLSAATGELSAAPGVSTVMPPPTELEARL